MPKFSAFAPFGLLRYSAKPSVAEDIYHSLVGAQSNAFDMTEGSPEEAEAYATAMALGRARAVQERAKNQRDTDKAFDMLPALERDYGVVPGETATVRDRQNALSLRKAISRGPRAESIESALLTLLGSDFITYRVLTTSEKATWPATPSAGPGVFGRDEIPAKVFVSTSAISVLGSAVSFSYEEPSGADSVRLVAGDVVCFDAGNLSQAEKVTITAVGPVYENIPHATATFTKSHDSGASITTGPIPIWQSSKRHVIVVVSAAASVDPETRRKIDDLMGRISRGVTTWSIAKASSATTVGPLVVGELVGSTIIGTLTIP